MAKTDFIFVSFCKGLRVLFRTVSPCGEASLKAKKPCRLHRLRSFASLVLFALTGNEKKDLMIWSFFPFPVTLRARSLTLSRGPCSQAGRRLGSVQASGFFNGWQTVPGMCPARVLLWPVTC